MKASPRQLSKFLQTQDTQFVIPIYQRNYDWNEDHCKQLLEDIIEVGKTSKEEQRMHFIGSIVYVCNDEYTTDEIEQFVVIDGQQRITTITLLLIALYHHARENGDERLAETILEYYLVNKNADDDEFKVKLKATENNDRDLHLLLNDRPIPSSKYSNIKNNYNFFKTQLHDTNIDIIYEGFRRLLFVEIRLERGKDNAQKIFESLNSTGLDLSQADLIRNYILMGLEPAEQNKLYTHYWAEIESNTKIEGASHVSDFIRDYLTIKKSEIPKKDAVYTTFKKQFRIEEIDIDPVLAELRNYSAIYQKLINPSTVEDKDIRKELAYIKYIEINVSYPFLMQLIDDYNRASIDKPTLIRILRFVQTFTCRRFILDLPTNALNKIFMTLYRQVDKANYENSIYHYVMTRPGKNRMPSDIEIRTMLADKDFYNAKSRMKMYILERMENYDNNEPVEIIDNCDMTIEHIFPQNPDSKWNRDLPEKEYADFANLHLHTIGNLTLSGNNGALGNKPFMEKKWMNKNGKEQGYAFSRLLLNRFLKEIDEWNIANYQKRTDILIKRFINIWQLPQVEGLREFPEQNINDIDDPTNKQIEYAVFFGKRLDGDKYKGIKLYNYVIKELYRMQPENFIEQFASLLKLRETPEGLTRYQPLNSTYFYDTNLSYQSLFSNLRTMLQKMELSDELYIKFRGASRTLFDDENIVIDDATEEDMGEKQVKDRCVEQIEKHFGISLVKQKRSRSAYKTSDGRIGFFFAVATPDSSSRGERYWFGYRNSAVLEDCEHVYYAFCCKDESCMAVMSQDYIDNKTWQMNFSTDKETGEISHWHVVLHKKANGSMTWLLSKPDVHEEDITEKLLQQFDAASL